MPHIGKVERPNIHWLGIAVSTCAVLFAVGLFLPQEKPDVEGWFKKGKSAITEWWREITADTATRVPIAAPNWCLRYKIMYPREREMRDWSPSCRPAKILYDGGKLLPGAPEDPTRVEFIAYLGNLKTHYLCSKKEDRCMWYFEGEERNDNRSGNISALHVYPDGSIEGTGARRNGTEEFRFILRREE